MEPAGHSFEIDKRTAARRATSAAPGALSVCSRGERQSESHERVGASSTHVRPQTWTNTSGILWQQPKIYMYHIN